MVGDLTVSHCESEFGAKNYECQWLLCTLHQFWKCLFSLLLYNLSVVAKGSFSFLEIIYLCNCICIKLYSLSELGQIIAVGPLVQQLV